MRFPASLTEVLSRPDDTSRAVSLTVFADAIDELAAKAGTHQLQAWQVLRALHEPNVMSLRFLRAAGLPMRRRDGIWWIDNREFRSWAAAPRPRRPTASMEAMF